MAAAQTDILPRNGTSFPEVTEADRRIVVLASYAPSLIRFRGSLIAELVRRGWHVTGAAPEVDNDVARQLKRLGVDFVSVPMERDQISPLADLKTVYRITKMLKRLRPQVLLSYTIKPVIYGSLAAQFAGIPRNYAMITGLGNAFSGNAVKARTIRRFAVGLYKGALRQTNAVFFQNEESRDLFYREKILPSATSSVLTNGSGVDVDEYRPRPVPAKPCFVLIARLLLAKGIREYAEAARRLVRDHPDVQVKLIGWTDGDARSVRREDLDAWVSEGTIDFLGRQEDVRPALHDATAFVLPTYYPEGIPRTILEAMACGRAVITTDTPGCNRAVVDGETGILVPPRDVDRLYEAMLRLVLDPVLAVKFGEAGRRRAEEIFDVRKVNQTVIAALEA